MSRRRVLQAIELLDSLVVCDRCRREQQNRYGTLGPPTGCLWCGHLYGTYAKEQQ